MERKTTLTIRADTSPLGRRITRLMVELDKNDRDFAEEIGIGYHTLRGVRRLQDPRPTQDTLEKIAAGLGTSPHWLLYGSDEDENAKDVYQNVTTKPADHIQELTRELAAAYAELTGQPVERINVTVTIAS